MKTWVLTKIISLLTTQEGFSTENTDEAGVIMQDAFGFRYQVQVKLLGRIADQAPFEGLNYAKESRGLAFEDTYGE